MNDESVDYPVTQQFFYIYDVERMIGKDRLTLRRWWTNGDTILPHDNPLDSRQQLFCPYMLPMSPK